MSQTPRFTLWDLVALALILVVAGLARGWYIYEVAGSGEQAGFITVQGELSEDVREIVNNVKKGEAFAATAPLSSQEEVTAHVAPGYPYIFALMSRYLDEPDRVMRWAQCVLGVLTVMCYFLFARRAFCSLMVAVLAGVLCAVHPFWIANTADINDGVLAAFLLAAALALGTRCGQDGGVLTSLLYGLSLASLAMVRAALLPFSIVALLWFFLRCRNLNRGWFCALLAFLGFANGIAPWTVRNLQQDNIGQVTPIVTSAYYHLWMGNNDAAKGSIVDEETLKNSLTPLTRVELTDKNQAERYAALGPVFWNEVSQKPADTLKRRLWSALCFVFGGEWFDSNRLALPTGISTANVPHWLSESYEGMLSMSLLLMLLAGFLGWRWAYLRRRESRLGTIALLLIPLPYFLGHAEPLAGPRLPIDGILLCLVAFALTIPVPKDEEPE